MNRVESSLSDHAGKTNRSFAVLIATAVLGGQLLFGLHEARGIENVGDVPSSGWLVAIEPSYMKPETARPISGSEKTLLAPAHLRDGKLAVMDSETYKSLGVGWDAYLRRARENLSALLEQSEAELIRDENRVLQCALIEGESQTIASLMLAENMLDRFDGEFGPELILLAPNRNMLFVFPRLASSFEQFFPDVLNAYKNSAYPVSLEVFVLDEEGLRVIGIIED